MPLGTEVGLGPGDIVLDGGPAPSPAKRDTFSNFRPMPIVAKRSPISATDELLLKEKSSGFLGDTTLVSSDKLVAFAQQVKSTVYKGTAVAAVYIRLWTE